MPSLSTATIVLSLDSVPTHCGAGLPGSPRPLVAGQALRRAWLTGPDCQPGPGIVALDYRAGPQTNRGRVRQRRGRDILSAARYSAPGSKGRAWRAGHGDEAPIIRGARIPARYRGPPAQLLPRVGPRDRPRKICDPVHGAMPARLRRGGPTSPRAPRLTGQAASCRLALVAPRITRLAALSAAGPRFAALATSYRPAQLGPRSPLPGLASPGSAGVPPRSGHACAGLATLTGRPDQTPSRRWRPGSPRGSPGGPARRACRPRLVWPRRDRARRRDRRPAGLAVSWNKLGAGRFHWHRPRNAARRSDHLGAHRRNYSRGSAAPTRALMTRPVLAQLRDDHRAGIDQGVSQTAPLLSPSSICLDRPRSSPSSAFVALLHPGRCPLRSTRRRKPAALTEEQGLQVDFLRCTERNSFVCWTRVVLSSVWN